MDHGPVSLTLQDCDRSKVEISATSVKTGLLTAAILVLPPGPVLADTTAQSTAPTEKKPGYHSENFRVRPLLSIKQLYDNNVFRTDRHTRSDWITLASPQLKVDSTWARHSLRLRAGAESGSYWEYDDEDYLDYWGSGEARFDLNGHTDLFGGLGFSYEHEGRDSPDSPARELEPTTYTSFTANAGLKTTFGDTSYRLGGTYENLDFDDVPGIGGPVINDDRDRELIGFGIRATHRLDEDNHVFLQASFDQRDYDFGSDQFGFKRSSDGYRAALGVIRDWGSGNEFEAYLGVLHQDYDDSRFDTVSKPDFGGRLTLVLDKATKIRAQLQRSLDETTDIGSPGYLNTSFSGRLQHHVSPRFIPYLNLGYSYYDFLETGRKDRTYSAGAGLKYFLTRNTYLVFGASHAYRDSNDKGLFLLSNDFEKTAVFLNFTALLYPLSNP